MKKLAIIVILFVLVLSLTGCWDYKELELIDLVYGAGVDDIEPDFTLVTEIMKYTGTGQEAKFDAVVLSTKSRSLSDASRSLKNLTGMFLFWPHAQIFVVSEEVARMGVLPAIEFFVRGADLRSSVFFFVTRDCTVEELFQSEPTFEVSVSQHLANLVSMHADSPTFYPQQMWEFTRVISKQGISAALPTVELVHQGENEVAIVRGTAIFENDRMIDWLDAEQSEIFSLLRGLTHRGRFVMDTLAGGQDNPLTYEVRGNQVKRKINVVNEKIQGEINMQLQLDLIDIQDAKIDFLNSAIVSEIEKQVAAYFNRRIRELLIKLQKNEASDPLGWGQLLKQNHQEVWRANMDNWAQLLADLDVDINVKTKITFSGVTGRSTPVRY